MKEVIDELRNCIRAIGVAMADNGLKSTEEMSSWNMLTTAVTKLALSPEKATTASMASLKQRFIDAKEEITKQLAPDDRKKIDSLEASIDKTLKNIINQTVDEASASSSLRP